MGPAGGRAAEVIRPVRRVRAAGFAATMTRGRVLVHGEVLPAEVEEESEAAVAEAGERSDDALGRKLRIADEVDVDHGTALA